MTRQRDAFRRGRMFGRLDVQPILTDLITKLRAEHWVYPGGDDWCQGCGEYQPCPSLRFAAHAETRLQDLTRQDSAPTSVIGHEPPFVS